MAKGAIALALLLAACHAAVVTDNSAEYFARYLYPELQNRLLAEVDSNYPFPKASELNKDLIPSGLQGVRGVAVATDPETTISEGMGFALFSAGIYWDKPLLRGLTVGWQAMNQGAAGSKTLGGCSDFGNAGNCLCGTVPGADMPAWRFPLNSCTGGDCRGSATSGDQDAITGIMYLAELTNDSSLRELTVKLIAAFVEDDIGGGSLGTKTNSRPVPVVGDVPKNLQRMFLWRGGSCWGGYDTTSGDSNLDLCINPGRFSPGQWRLFSRYVLNNAKYVPAGFTAQGIADTLNSAIVWGYNLLERISCPDSGLVSNWWTLPTKGWPWQGKLQCANGGTEAGAYGADAVSTPWRVALDSIWFGDESLVPHFNEQGKIDGVWGSANYSLRIARKYREMIKAESSACPDFDCIPLEKVLPMLQKFPKCDNCPKGNAAPTTSAWGFWPPVVAFTQEDEQLDAWESKAWLDQLVWYVYSYEYPPPKYYDLMQYLMATGIMGGGSKPPFPYM